MNCNCDNKAIVIVRNNDTDWNGGKLATINLVTEILDLSNFTATLNMSGVIKTFDDLSSGSIEVNLSAQETKNLPPRFDGILNLIDNTKKVATIESLIPFKVISQVHGNAIATEPYTLNFDVKQGGETILTVNVESAVTVEVGTTTTLPATEDATVTNSGTDNHLVLDFGIPKGNGIASIEKTSSSDLVDTYTVTFDEGNTTTFEVTNGNGIKSIAKTGTSGLVDTYTITFDNGTETFTVTNGSSIASIEKTSTSGLVDTYTVTLTNGDTSTFTVTNGQDGADGQDGTNATITGATATVTNTVGIPSVTVTAGGTASARSFNFAFTNLKGDKGDTGAGMVAEVVQTLPVTGETGKIYLVPKTTPAQEDIYDEYIWAIVSTNPDTYDWEHIGSTDIDLTGYATEQWVLDKGYIDNSAISNMVTTNTAQDITATKTFKEQQRIQSGNAGGALIIGADVANTTLTNNTRKLGRMSFPTNEDITLNCAFVSCDTQSATGSGIENSVDFGGRLGDTTSTSPDALTFTVAKEHNTTTNTKKMAVLRMTKDGADFSVQPTYNGVGFCPDTNGEVKGSAWNGQLTVTRTTSGGSFITFKNTVSNAKTTLGAIGLGAPNAIPTWIDATNTNTNVLVRGGAFATPAVGNASTPVYVDSNGIAQECTGVQEKVTVTTLSSNDSITLADNTCFKGGSISAFTITVPSTDIYPFVCEIDFTSPSTATTITYSGTIVWDSNSDDLINDVFVPAASKEYTMMFWFNGTNYCGTVTGV